MPIFNRSPKPITVEELRPIVDRLTPEIGYLGGRFFKDPKKNVSYSLNTIIMLFENTIKGPMNQERRAEAKIVLDKIKALDKEGEELLDLYCSDPESVDSLWFLLTTSVRRISNIFFDRAARMEKLENAIVRPPRSERAENEGGYEADVELFDSDDEDFSSESESVEPLQPNRANASFEDALSSDDESELPAQNPLPAIPGGASDDNDERPEQPLSAPVASPRAAADDDNVSAPVRPASAPALSPRAAAANDDSGNTSPAPVVRDNRFIWNAFRAFMGLDGAEILQPAANPLGRSFTDSFVVLPNERYDQNLYFLLNLEDENDIPISVREGIFVQQADQLPDATLCAALKEMTAKASKAVEDALNNLKDAPSTANFKALRIALDYELGVYKGIQIISANNNVAAIESELAEISRGAKSTIEPHFDRFTQFIESNQNTGILTKSFIRPSTPPQTLADKAIASSLEAFCANWGNEFPIEQVQSMIDKGKILMAAINAGTAQPGTEEDLVHLTWFLMAQAIKKKEGYQEGAFMIEDDGQKLFQYLRNARGENGSVIYERPSTHFKGRTDKQYGLDVFSPLMPCKKRTLLFGMIHSKDSDQKVLFIKPENFSACLVVQKAADAWYHGWEMIVAQKNKLLYEGLDDADNMRKERIPTEITKEFVKLLKLLRNQQGIDYKAVHADAKKYGISFMNKFLNDHADKGINPNRFRELIKDYDHLQVRTGREVYLTAP